MKRVFVSTLALVVLFLCFAPLYAASDTADEIVAEVAKASKIVAAKGDASFEELRNVRFLGGKGYLVIGDMNKVCLLNPFAASFEGKELTTVQSADGRYFVTEMVTMAQTQSKGWMSYMWMEPTTKTVQQKCVYFEKVAMPNGKEVLVQAGYYGTDCK